MSDRAPDHIAWNTYRGVPTELVRFFDRLFSPGYEEMSDGEKRYHRLRARCIELRELNPSLGVMHRAREGDGSLVT